MLTHDVGGSGLVELVVIELQGRAAPYCVGHRLCGELWQPMDWRGWSLPAQHTIVMICWLGHQLLRCTAPSGVGRSLHDKFWQPVDKTASRRLHACV